MSFGLNTVANSVMKNRIPVHGMSSYSEDSWKLTDSFDTAYWSGEEVEVFANDINLSEHIQTTYQIVEQVRPYYSYDKYVAARLHHGTRIIAGEINVNFKRHGYLFSLLNAISSRQGSIYAQAASQKTPTALVNDPTNNNEDLALIDQTRGGAALRNLIDSVKRKTADIPRVTSPTVATAKGLFETSTRGFDLTIIFGSSLDSARTLRYHRNEVYVPDGVVTSKEDGISSNLVATGIKILGVSITGLSKTIDDSGRPIIETYSFQAKDVRILENQYIKGTPENLEERSGFLDYDVQRRYAVTNS